MRDQIVQIIYEGTNDIQEGEVLRVIAQTRGESLTFLLNMILRYIGDPHDDMFVNCVDDYLRIAVDRCYSISAKFFGDMQSSDPLKKQMPLLYAHNFVCILGHTIMAWMLCSIADEAARELRARHPKFSEEQLDQFDLNSDEVFYWNKIQAVILFCKRILSQVQGLYDPIDKSDVSALKFRI